MGWNIRQSHYCPLFINENLKDEMYADMLDRRINPCIIYEVENKKEVDGNLVLDEHLLHFQHDEVPSQYVCPVREKLENHYPECYNCRYLLLWNKGIVIDFFRISCSKSILNIYRWNNVLLCCKMQSMNFSSCSCFGYFIIFKRITQCRLETVNLFNCRS